MKISKLCLALFLLASAGCAFFGDPPDPRIARSRPVEDRHDRSLAARLGREKSSFAAELPVIFIPGIKGSLIFQRRDGEWKGIWGTERVLLFHNFDDLTLDVSSAMLEEVGGPIHYPFKADRILATFDIGTFIKGFKPLQYDIYRYFLSILENAGKYQKAENLKEGNLFLFPYDWRLDNRVAAVQLEYKLPLFRAQFEKWVKKNPERTAAWERFRCEESNGKYFARVDGKGCGVEIRFKIIAHSMGGLVAKYLIRRLGHAKDVYRVVFVGTPSLGSMDALKAFREGEAPLGLIPGFFNRAATRRVLFTFPAMFQLLPRYPGAPERGEDAHRLGLDEPWPGSALDLDLAVETWKRANLIPKGLERVGPPGPFPTERYLRRQLLSAWAFHWTLRPSYFGSDRTVEEFEREQLGRVRAFVQEHFCRPRGLDCADTSGAPWSAENLAALRDLLQYGRSVVFGGICDETEATYSLAKGEGNELTLTFGNKGFGDGRVALASAKDHPFQRYFFICADHVGIMRDPTFQDNLIREIKSP